MNCKLLLYSMDQKENCVWFSPKIVVFNLNTGRLRHNSMFFYSCVILTKNSVYWFPFFSERIEVLEKTKVPVAFTGTTIDALNRLNRENIRCKWQIHSLTILTHKKKIYIYVLQFLLSHVREVHFFVKIIDNHTNFKFCKIFSFIYQKTTQGNALQMSIWVIFFFFYRLEPILFVFNL